MAAARERRLPFLAVAVAVLGAIGCRGHDTAENAGAFKNAPADGESPAVSHPPPSLEGAFTIESLGIAAGNDAGPSCASAGDPTLGVDAGASCTGALAAETFTYGLCACTTLEDSESLTTDGFDATKGAPDGGLGANVGANTSVSWSTASSIGGTLWTPGNVTASSASTVRGDLHLGGTLSASGTFTVNGNAFVEKTLPSAAKVKGTTTKIASLASPCNCSNIVPVAAITAAHRAPNNDDATIGLSPSALVGNNPPRVDLPCGNYYLSQISASLPLTIAVHGHTALYVDGNLQAAQALSFLVDPTATLDLFVAGTFVASQTLTLGSTANPAHCRAFVAGAKFTVSEALTFGCNLYAPSALVTLANSSTLYGSLLANAVHASGNAAVHYDTSVLNAASECCSAASCNGGNPCTVDACNGDGTCTHTLAANGTACSDGNACTANDTCQAGVCKGGAAVTCTASDACHTAGTCNTTTGVCSNPVAANGTACSDGNACTANDTCQAGVCKGARPSRALQATRATRPVRATRPRGSARTLVAANGTACSDGNACTANDRCQAGVCKGGTAVTCTASDACHTAGTCNTTTGVCSNPVAANGTACSDGNACTANDTCQAGFCQRCVAVTCTASDACHTAGTCNTTTGVCSNPVAANGTACSDGNACTANDTCQAGVCQGGVAVTCTASDACHTAGTCNTTTGVCSNPVAANGTACSDGNACTANDSCQAGVCKGGTAVTCTASDACHTAGTCNTTTGVCSNPVAANGTACSDGDACTANDTCQNGTCNGAPVTCTAPDQCSLAGTCNPATGACSSTPIAGCSNTSDHWTTGVGRPTPREGAGAVAAPVQNTLLLFGGENAGVPLADLWTWSRATGLWTVSYSGGPPARADAAIAYDSTRNRLVVFGGIARSPTGDMYLGDTWEYDPVAAAWSNPLPSTSPSPRAFAAVAVDSGRQRTVVFGGRSPGGPAESASVWEWDGSTWTQRQASAPPPGRAGSAMAYDSARARLVLFGGETVVSPQAGLVSGDTWEMDTATANWSSVPASNPPPARLGHGMYYDTARAKIVVFGGSSGAQLEFADTWEYDGPATSWVQRVTSVSPPARAGHALSYDPATGHGLLATGVTYSTTGAHSPELDDVWELDPIASTWSPRTVDLAPATYRPGTAYDVARQALVLRGSESHPAMWELAAGRWSAKDMLNGMTADFGQSFAGFSQANNQTVGANYSEISTNGAMVYDPGRARTILIEEGLDITNGLTPVVSPPAVWEWDGVQWQERQCPGGPPGMTNAAIAFDAAREKVVVAGGGQFSFQTWEIDAATCAWTQIRPLAQPPPRINAMMAWDSARGVSVLFGGLGPSAFLSDTWEWDGVAQTWTERGGSSNPPGRESAGLAFDSGRSRLVLFGGSTGTFGTFYNDVWEFDGVAGAWSLVAPAGGSPSPRMNPSFIYDPNRGRLVLYGGGAFDPTVTITDLSVLSDLWEWDGAAWTPRILGASPSARSGAAGGWIPARNMCVLFGGVHGDGERALLDDTWIWRNGSWSIASGALADMAPSAWVSGAATAIQPPPRAGHAFAVGLENGQFNTDVGLLFGGEGESGLLNDTWMWNDQTFTWTQQEPNLSPSARTGHAIATMPGVGFLLFGGSDATGAILGDEYVWDVAFGGWQLQFFAAPSARTEAAMATDVLRNKIVLFGGRGPSGALADTWEYDIIGETWTQRTPATAPAARFGHSLFFDPSRGTVILVGGTGTGPVTNDGDAWEWNGYAGTWSQVFANTGLGPRSGAVGFFDATAGRSTVFGGLAYGASGAAVGTYGDTSVLVRANEQGVNGVACAQGTACASGSCVQGLCAVSAPVTP